MKKVSICVGDTGAIITLAIIDKLGLLDLLFENIYIPQAVWNELIDDDSFAEVDRIKNYFVNKVRKIQSVNDLKLIMDKGESEAILLYQEMKADALLIDDQKAREIAESLGIICVGSLALLIKARETGEINDLRTIFKTFLKNKRYFSKQLLNAILHQFNEPAL